MLMKCITERAPHQQKRTSVKKSMNYSQGLKSLIPDYQSQSPSQTQDPQKALSTGPNSQNWGPTPPPPLGVGYFAH